MAAAITIIIAAALFLSHHSGWYLTLRDGETGKVYARYPITEGEQFAVGFIHSVNKTPVIDVYEVKDHGIYVAETIYYSLGAGVQTQLNPGETLAYGEDGSMIVGNIHKPFDQVPLCYLVASVSDHTLLLGNISPYRTSLKGVVGLAPQPQQPELEGLTIISLGELCGRRVKIVFTCEYGFFF